MAPKFRIPSDGELFTDQILKRCEDLISSGIWEGLTKVRLDTWMTNFRNPTEQYFAASILDALVFRSEKQTVAMMETLFQRTIPDFLRMHEKPPRTSRSWLDLLQDASWLSNPPIRVVPVIREDDPPSKSGPALCRMYRRYMNLNQRWMIWPWQIASSRAIGIKKFLFIDDFLGTGDQFYKFANEFGLPVRLSGCDAVYAPLTAHRSGIKWIQDQVPNFDVAAVELIDDSYSIFADSSPWFADGLNSAASASALYDDLVTRAQLAIDPLANRGVGNLSLTYAFSHATPDNSLPLLWAEGRNWKPLLER